MSIRRAILRANSDPLNHLLDPAGPWMESGKGFVELNDDTAVSMELWFYLIRNVPTLVKGDDSIRIAEVW
jgi:hypothetical protein